MITSVIPANDGKHKYIAIFSNGKRVKFGAYGYEDYLIHKDKERRERYRTRHRKDLDTRDPYRAGFLSFYLLWSDYTNLNDAIRAYNRRFFSS